MNYGYLGNTLAKDDDPLDVNAIPRTLHTGTFVRSDVYGYFEVYDNGTADHKASLARSGSVTGDSTRTVSNRFSAPTRKARGSLYPRESALT